MTWFLIPPAVILIAAGVFLSLIASRPAKDRQTAPFLSFFYAHRGLHSADRTVPENSLAAFRRAVRHGYGIELDVRLTADGEVVVLHDDEITRVCGVPGKASALEYEALRQFPLGESEERIPLFSEALAAVGGRTPLIVELKSGPRRKELCEKTLALLKSYGGPYCVESFDPRIVRWFARHAKRVLRGQLADGRGDPSLPKIARFFHRNLLINGYAKPHFIAYRHEDAAACRNLARCRKWFRLLTVAWTVRSEEELAQAKERFDLVIFERFLP